MCEGIISLIEAHFEKRLCFKIFTEEERDCTKKRQFLLM